MGAVLSWAIRVFGPIALEWTVEQLLAKWEAAHGTATEVPDGDEPYIWEQEECLPSE